jgi:hypothetical protein
LTKGDYWESFDCVQQMLLENGVWKGLGDSCGAGMPAENVAGVVEVQDFAVGKAVLVEEWNGNLSCSEAKVVLALWEGGWHPNGVR